MKTRQDILKDIVSLTDLEIQALKSFLVSSGGNGHDFGFTDEIEISGKSKQAVGGVVSSLIQKRILSCDIETKQVCLYDIMSDDRQQWAEWLEEIFNQPTTPPTKPVKRKIKSTRQGSNAAYSQMCEKANKIGETNDCSLRAITAITGADYEHVVALSYEFGRKKGHGTLNKVTMAILDKLGFKAIAFDSELLTCLYPGSHKKLNSITSHHPERFERVWPLEPKFLFSSHTHMWAVVNGRNIDWTEGRACRAVKQWVVVPKDHKLIFPSALIYLDYSGWSFPNYIGSNKSHIAEYFFKQAKF